MAEEKKAPEFKTDHSWSVLLTSRNIRVETNDTDYDSFDFVDESPSADQTQLMTLSFDEFEALYLKVKECRETYAKLMEKKT